MLESSGFEDQPSSGIRTFVEARFAALPAEVKEVLEAAAILGDNPGSESLGTLLPAMSREEILRALSLAREARLLAPPDPRRSGPFFALDIVRETLLATMAPDLAEHMHARAFDSLRNRHGDADGANLEAMVYHGLRAPPPVDPSSLLRLTQRAAAQLARANAYDQAVNHLRRGLQIFRAAPPPSEREAEELELRTELDLASLLGRLDRREEARAVILSLIQRAKAKQFPGLVAQATLGLMARGDVSLTPAPGDLALMEEAAELVRDSEPLLRSELLLRMAMAHYFIDGSEDFCRAATEEGVAIAAATGDEEIEAVARTSAHFARWGPDEPLDRGIQATRALAAGRTREDPEIILGALFWRLCEAVERGDMESAAGDLQQYTSLAEERGEPFYLHRIAVLRATFELMGGRYSEAAHTIEKARRLGDDISSPGAPIVYAWQHTHLLLQRGERDRALAEARAALALLGEPPAAQAFLLGILAGGPADGELLHRFERLAQPGFAFRRDHSWLYCMISCAKACVALGDRERAARLYEELLPFADRVVVVGFLDGVEGAVARWLASLAATRGDLPAAVEMGRRAIEIERGLGAWPLLAQSEFELAQWLERAPSETVPEEAAELAGRAAETAQRLGMQELERSARALLAEPAPETDPGPPRFTREAGAWIVAFRGRRHRFRDAKGLRQLAFLIERPGQAVHVWDLRIAADGGPVSPPAPIEWEQEGMRIESRPGPEAPRGHDEARVHLASLRAALAEAEAHGERARAAALEQEIESFAARFGDHRVRNAPEVERARKAVLWSIRAAVQRIARVDEDLAGYLARHVRTGSACRFDP